MQWNQYCIFIFLLKLTTGPNVNERLEEIKLAITLPSRATYSDDLSNKTSIV